MYNDFDNYKKKDPRMWFFHTKVGKIIFRGAIIVVIVLIILKLLGIE